ncbi:MAG: glycogen synthase [Planctomycetes bacterium]|nr:glycogen synthase [Planctomycetota bacterium]
MSSHLRILLISREYPPNVYGGAGVHVEHLSRELARLAEVEVRCFGSQKIAGGHGQPAVRGFSGPAGLECTLNPRLQKAFEPLATDVAIAGADVQAEIVHCHTWYSMMAGLWIKILHGIPLVITTHSLEPLRPWKEEQLGSGYRLSSWLEKTALESADAVIAVSKETRQEVLGCYRVEPERVHIIHNGIDLNIYRRTDPLPVLRRYGIDPEKPYLLFVGRITRQKGILHLVRALPQVPAGVQAVLCAGAPDTPEIGREMAQAVEEIKKVRPGVYWIPEMVPVPDLRALYSGAAVFVCPSVYEPFGIINLEAMACETPVVASRVGGIPEVVVDGETGFLVPFEQNPSPNFEPRQPEQFARDLAAAAAKVLGEPERARKMGKAGRARVEAHFSWESIARRTLSLYQTLVRK